MKRFYSCFLCICLWNLSAQQVVIVDETNAEPIAGVAVFNLVKTKTNISNLDGVASIARFQSFERILLSTPVLSQRIDFKIEDKRHYFFKSKINESE